MCLEFKIHTHTGRSFSPTSQFSVVVGLCCFCFGFVFCFCFVLSATQQEACGILVAHPGIEPEPPAEEVWGHNHWTIREVPTCFVGVFACSWGGHHFPESPVDCCSVYTNKHNKIETHLIFIFSHAEGSILVTGFRILPFSLKTVVLGNLTFR